MAENKDGPQPRNRNYIASREGDEYYTDGVLENKEEYTTYT